MELQAADGGMTIAAAKARLLSYAADEDRRGTRGAGVAPALLGAAVLGAVVVGTLAGSRRSALGRVARLAVAIRLARWVVPTAMGLAHRLR